MTREEIEAINRERVRADSRDTRAKIKAAIRKAKRRPCADCGRRFPYYCMDLDHVRGAKKFTIGLKGFGYRQLLVELDKCDAVCANCHRIRTHRRGYAGRNA